jgi:hypothetical protein
MRSPVPVATLGLPQVAPRYDKRHAQKLVDWRSPGCIVFVSKHIQFILASPLLTRQSNSR